MGLPCSRYFPLLLAVRTPGAPLPLALSRPAVRPSPLRDRVGYSDHVRFRGYFPVHFIPAYNLPVYAQRPLPDATQDSVRSCSLGFAATAISDGRLQRACKAQLPHHRTYGSVYGGSLDYAAAGFARKQRPSDPKERIGMAIVKAGLLLIRQG